jgi:hypothetical protein
MIPEFKGDDLVLDHAPKGRPHALVFWTQSGIEHVLQIAMTAKIQSIDVGVRLRVGNGEAGADQNRRERE